MRLPRVPSCPPRFLTTRTASTPPERTARAGADRRLPSPLVDLLSYSNDVIDRLRTDSPTNRISQELSELARRSRCRRVVLPRVGGAHRRRPGAVRRVECADRRHRVLQAIRTWTNDPIHTIVYTHGHADHVGGAAVFVAEAEARGHRRPRFVGHANVAPRLARYRRDQRLQRRHQPAPVRAESAPPLRCDRAVRGPRFIGGRRADTRRRPTATS